MLLASPAVSSRARALAVSALLAFLAWMTLSPGRALAHAPIYLNGDHTSPDAAQPLGDPASPGLVYGTLPAGGAQYVSFSISATQPFHAMVLRTLRADSFNPAIAIVGPGLGDPTGAPFAVPDGDGVLYVSPPDRAVPILVADLGLRFLAGAGFDGPLGEDGDYYLVMYGADGGGGDYAVGTGYGA
jgi:hypothetical protein